MKRLLILLLLLCTVTGLFACWAPQNTTQPSTTAPVGNNSSTTTNGSDGSSSTVLTPEILEPGEGPELPKVTLPGGTLSPTSPPEYTVPVEPPTTQPPTEIS